MERQSGMIFVLFHLLVPKLRHPGSLGDLGPPLRRGTVPSFTLNLFFFLIFFPFSTGFPISSLTQP